MSGSPRLSSILESDNKSPQLCTTLSTSAWKLSLHHHCLLGKFSSLVPHSTYVACFQIRNHCFLGFVCTVDLKSDCLPASIVVSFGKLLGYLALIVSCCLTPSFYVLYTAQVHEDTLYPDPLCLMRRNNLLKTHAYVCICLNDFVSKLENNAPKVLLL